MSAQSQDAAAPKGSYVAGRRVVLPEGAESPIIVFINGVAQTEGEDYELSHGEIVFRRGILKETKSGRRKLIMMLGAIGFYNKHETIDVQFQRDGKTELAADLQVSE